MEDYNRGLMASSRAAKKKSPMLEQFMDELSTQNKPNLPLEDRLSSVSDSERSTLMALAKLVRIIMRLREATNDNSMTYLDLITKM